MPRVCVFYDADTGAGFDFQLPDSQIDPEDEVVSVSSDETTPILQPSNDDSSLPMAAALVGAAVDASPHHAFALAAGPPTSTLRHAIASFGLPETANEIKLEPPLSLNKEVAQGVMAKSAETLGHEVVACSVVEPCPATLGVAAPDPATRHLQERPDVRRMPSPVDPEPIAKTEGQTTKEENVGDCVYADGDRAGVVQQAASHPVPLSSLVSRSAPGGSRDDAEWLSTAEEHHEADGSRDARQRSSKSRRLLCSEPLACATSKAATMVLPIAPGLACATSKAAPLVNPIAARRTLWL